jgi:nitrous oxidase accessory protein
MIRILIISCLLLIYNSHAYAKIWRVVPGSSLSTIKAALELCSEGDTLRISPGVYKEGNLIIRKRVYLQGEKGVILDGERKHEVLTIVASGTMVEGIRIRHSGFSSLNDLAGIKLFQVRNVTIRNNIFEDTYFGIYCQNVTACRIERNSFLSYAENEITSGNGIHGWKSDSLEIIGNDIRGHRDGIYFEFVTESLIRNNHCEKNLRYGLHFMFSHNDTYINNTFIRNGAGVAVMYTKGVRMYNNRFLENWGNAAYGILMKDISDSEVRDNIFRSNTSAIFMEGSNRIQMHRNVFAANGWAIKMQASCGDIAVHHNNFIGNTFDVATNGSLVMNTYNFNFWDKYDGYDLNRDGKGDVPYRPVSMYSMIVERNPVTMMLFRSFMVSLLERAERIIPSLTPEQLKDEQPSMKPLTL